ncbi:ubiquitin-related domain-containing protein [Umbelopsis sp. PMI_123]|nr:ubiquitin-related domain-containing protein [Umbelopsis sp. PMI_123]
MATDIDTLVAMGFPRNRAEKAWKKTNGAGLQPAMDWLLEHSDDADIDDPVTEGQSLQGSATSSATPAGNTEDEGEIKDGEQTAQSLICNDCQKLFRDAAAAERHAIRTSHQNFSESTEAIKPLTEEEKKEKLAELKARLAEKRALRELQEKEEAKSNEKIRRKTGQEITLAKEKLEEEQMQKAFAAKKKEKEEEKAAKAKIKAQIEADKRERAAKRDAAKQSAQIQAQAQAQAEAAAAAKPTVKKDYTESRLQIRVPGASPITQTFSADSQLEDVAGFLRENGHAQSFTISTTYPRKTFQPDEYSKTLKELDLVPSAVLVLNIV